MKKFAYTFPILADKIDQWLEFVKEVNTSRKEDFSEMHKRIGAEKESWFLQETADGYAVVVYTEAKDDNFMTNFKNDQTPFSDWFRQNVFEIQNIDLNSKTKMPIKVLDWEE